VESIIGETGEPIKLLMSDGSKQVQLNFDIGEGGERVGRRCGATTTTTTERVHTDGLQLS
jgi:hypothetical protein